MEEKKSGIGQSLLLAGDLPPCDSGTQAPSILYLSFPTASVFLASRPQKTKNRRLKKPDPLFKGLTRNDRALFCSYSVGDNKPHDRSWTQQKSQEVSGSAALQPQSHTGRGGLDGGELDILATGNKQPKNGRGDAQIVKTMYIE